MTLAMDLQDKFATTCNEAAEKAGFSYDELDAEIGEKLQACAKRIKTGNQTLNETIFAIGRALNEAKDLVPHGRFLAWLRFEFNWPERTAQRYMRIARVLGDKTATVSDLTLRAMDALTARSTPEELREEVLAELAAGRKPSNHELVARLKANRHPTVSEEAADDADAATEEVPPVISPMDAGRQAAKLIRAHLTGDLAALRRLLEWADAGALLAALQEEG